MSNKLKKRHKMSIEEQVQRAANIVKHKVDDNRHDLFLQLWWSVFAIACRRCLGFGSKRTLRFMTFMDELGYELFGDPISNETQSETVARLRQLAIDETGIDVAIWKELS